MPCPPPRFSPLPGASHGRDARVTGRNKPPRGRKLRRTPICEIMRPGSHGPARPSASIFAHRAKLRLGCKMAWGLKRRAGVARRAGNARIVGRRGRESFKLEPLEDRLHLDAADFDPSFGTGGIAQVFINAG